MAYERFSEPTLTDEEAELQAADVSNKVFEQAGCLKVACLVFLACLLAFAVAHYLPGMR